MRSSLPLAIIQLEAPPEAVSNIVGEQQHWFIAALGLEPDEYIVVRPDLGEALPEPGTISAAILSGSWAMVTDHAEWSERTAAWIRSAVEQALPLLGVCYGHQLMAYALGGVVDDNPRGWERGLQQLEMNDNAQHDPLLSALPVHFSAWLSHRQSVVQPPPGAQVLAASALDRCQIIRYTPQALSVQFHPEFTSQIMSACLQNSQGSEALSSLVAHQQEPGTPLQLLQDFWQQHRQLSKLA
ncbi:glutamine amidotransferase [Erwinia pyri]|uniref:Glutamine amidotransferase n=1 Tax=Erwinia pyri TaxID=3062598 RepID=A0AA50DFH1_9GAMM|nr:glutamine amidotransferase [Erwinia sp. DE2]WLS77306.1 glutamine amidotransferase [Erwinia sp. DE2]